MEAVSKYCLMICFRRAVDRGLLRRAAVLARVLTF